MKSLKKFAGLAAILVAVTVQAQTAPPQAISAAEMRIRVEAIDKDIDNDLRHVLHLQATARKEKDVIKLTCINDKLVQLKAQMNIFEASQLQLEAAINNTDDSPRTIFAELEQAGSDVRKLRSEADQCAGELEMYKQESKSDVERPDLDDPTQTGGDFDNDGLNPDIDVPGFATPYK